MQEIDVVRLQVSRLTQAEVGERAHRNERGERKLRRTSYGDGIVIDASRLRWRGSRTPSVGSALIKPSRTAVRTARGRSRIGSW
jgi:hypothetical protein